MKDKSSRTFPISFPQLLPAPLIFSTLLPLHHVLQKPHNLFHALPLPFLSMLIAYPSNGLFLETVSPTIL